MPMGRTLPDGRRRWREDGRFFVRGEVRRLRLRFKLGLAVVALVAIRLFAPLWLPTVADPLIADYAGLRTEAIVVEAWYALEIRMAREIARIRRGQRVYVIVNGEVEDPYGFSPDRPGQTLLNLVRAGVDTSKAVVLMIPPVPDVPGHTAFYAASVRKRMLEDSVRSFTLFTDAFHSERSRLIYSRAFSGTGIAIDCYPAPQTFDRGNWWRTTSGMRYVMGEYIKLGYYLFRGFR